MAANETRSTTPQRRPIIVAEFVVRSHAINPGVNLFPDCAGVFFGLDVRHDAAPATLAGERIVFTGDLGLDRAAARALASSSGASVATRVDRTTTLLVAGADPGTRLIVARALGVRVISADQFLALAGGRA